MDFLKLNIKSLDEMLHGDGLQMKVTLADIHFSI